MSYGDANSYFYINIDKNENGEKLAKELQENASFGFFDFFYENFKNLQHENVKNICIGFKWLEVGSGFDYDLESLASYLKKHYKKEIKGYATYEGDGTYRLEIHKGKVDYISTDWLIQYNNKEIEKLKKYAEKHFLN